MKYKIYFLIALLILNHNSLYSNGTSEMMIIGAPKAANDVIRGKYCKNNCQELDEEGPELYEALSKSMDINEAMYSMPLGAYACLINCRVNIMTNPQHYMKRIDGLIANFKPANNALLVDPILDQKAITYLRILLGMVSADFKIDKTVLHTYFTNKDPRIPIERNQHTARYQEVSEKLRIQYCNMISLMKPPQSGITCPQIMAQIVQP